MERPAVSSAVHTSAKFGSQTQDLNISLTAVGLLWNLSDYFFQNQDTLKGNYYMNLKLRYILDEKKILLKNSEIIWV